MAPRENKTLEALKSIIDTAPKEDLDDLDDLNDLVIERQCAIKEQEEQARLSRSTVPLSQVVGVDSDDTILAKVKVTEDLRDCVRAWKSKNNGTIAMLSGGFIWSLFKDDGAKATEKGWSKDIVDALMKSHPNPNAPRIRCQVAYGVSCVFLPDDVPDKPSLLKDYLSAMWDNSVQATHDATFHMSEISQTTEQWFVVDTVENIVKESGHPELPWLNRKRARG